MVKMSTLRGATNAASLESNFAEVDPRTRISRPVPPTSAGCVFLGFYVCGTGGPHLYSATSAGAGISRGACKCAGTRMEPTQRKPCLTHPKSCFRRWKTSAVQIRCKHFSPTASAEGHLGLDAIHWLQYGNRRSPLLSVKTALNVALRKNAAQCWGAGAVALRKNGRTAGPKVWCPNIERRFFARRPKSDSAPQSVMQHPEPPKS